MNERIRELAEQARGTKKHVPPVWQFYDIELKKFAELIVRECIKELENDTRCRIAGADKIVAKHFGVEK